MKSKLTPVNKYLVVEREQVKPMEDKPFFLPKSDVLTRHVLVTLKAASEGSQFERYCNQKLVILSGMMEEIDVRGDKHQVIPETAVIAVIAESDLF